MAVGALGWALAYLCLSAAAFRVMAFDKMLARRGGWRVSEATLLGLAVFGWGGAKFAQRRLRHKTRKQPCARMLTFAVVPHGCLWGAVIALMA